ncbi:MAG: ROK family protein [Oscillospiraceae bacterium]|nr:ROK family protein [Oscillospiraceae bacterium]
MSYVFGIDLGGTAVKIGLFRDRELTEKFQIPTRVDNSGEAILPDIAKAVLDCMDRNGLDRSQVKGIGIGVPGPVDYYGVVNCCTNLNWGVFNLHEALYKETGLPVVGGNDANCAALGEYHCFGGEGSAIFVTLGTGVGGGIIYNGKLLEGAHGSAGELGHITVPAKEKLPCTCGKKGCIECYASATGIVRMAKMRLGKDLTCKEIFDLAEGGNQEAADVLEEVFDLLGEAIASACCVVDPDRVILGGGVSKAGEILRKGVEKYFNIHKFHACEGTQIVLSRLGNDAGMYGAMNLAMERL